jgi:hypothetical protein
LEPRSTQPAPAHITKPRPAGIVNSTLRTEHKATFQRIESVYANNLNSTIVLSAREVLHLSFEWADYAKFAKFEDVLDKGFTVANLRNMRQFYQAFPNRYALRSDLTWTHYRMLMRVNEPERREFYLDESVKCG